MSSFRLVKVKNGFNNNRKRTERFQCPLQIRQHEQIVCIAALLYRLARFLALWQLPFRDDLQFWVDSVAKICGGEHRQKSKNVQCNAQIAFQFKIECQEYSRSTEHDNQALFDMPYNPYNILSMSIFCKISLSILIFSKISFLILIQKSLESSVSVSIFSKMTLSISIFFENHLNNKDINIF